MYNRLNVEVCNRKKSSKQLTVKRLNETTNPQEIWHT
jgi:hypothetical protein